MQELEKILEKIEQRKARAEKLIVKPPHDKLDQVANDTAEAFIEAYKECQDIIRKHMKNEEDILKFYYCESEDDYYIGQRVQNMYYARYADGAFTWFMSRYLPWGKHVIAPETAWKEYTYPTEPKEIPFTEWLEGFIRKHMNDGWIPVDDRLPEDGTYLCTLAGELCGIEEPFTGMCGIENGIWDEPDCVIAWRPLPEPYRLERSRENEK